MGNFRNIRKLDSFLNAQEKKHTLEKTISRIVIK